MVNAAHNTYSTLLPIPYWSVEENTNSRKHCHPVVTCNNAFDIFSNTLYLGNRISNVFRVSYLIQHWLNVQLCMCSILLTLNSVLSLCIWNLASIFVEVLRVITSICKTKGKKIANSCEIVKKHSCVCFLCVYSKLWLGGAWFPISILHVDHHTLWCLNRKKSQHMNQPLCREINTIKNQS